ncbi:MAG: DUF4450 domain-containing protein [Nibricoccus sp.]
MRLLRPLTLAFLVACSCHGAFTVELKPNLEGQLDRPLRYRPEGTDFVIENGTEFFNRPLYGGNTAFRVDGGDKPEFLLYLPGRGGNLRFGIRVGQHSKWLHEADSIITRYRPGSLIYEIQDSLLGNGKLLVSAIALHDREGLIVKIEPTTLPNSVELIWAYGGVNGTRGRRDGDIGTEDVPISEYFQLKPEFCTGNHFEISGASFTLRSKPATLAGTSQPRATLALANAVFWPDLTSLLGSEGTPGEAPILIGHHKLGVGSPTFVAIERMAQSSDERGELATYREVKGERDFLSSPDVAAGPRRQSLTSDTLAGEFAAAEGHFRDLRDQVSVSTPDPFINAAVAALNVAADAVWDEPQGVVMHGAIAWRSKLLGWRGPYAMDALGWHDRTRRHLSYWAGRQNTSPIPDKLPPADENANLARSEAALHSNGDISNSHYDMNLVYIDALFRHLLWTGDLDFAQKVWPVIERHLAWERRLFRREFSNTKGEKLPLYEAYAAIWASDDLQYHGGGTAHASAYNFYHNKMAARLARLLGKDATPYERESELIARGMRELLWMHKKGMFAEFKDYLGLQRIHPSAALWSFYHVVDSKVPTPREAAQMSDFVEHAFAKIPVQGPGVPENLHVFPTSDWMPYTWSINNVVMGENIHTALAFWQSGRAEEAYLLLKSALTASMFMGISPGNVGSMNYLDVYRRESQRDFGDGSGVTSRAIVEGLFGIKPDLLDGVLVFAPGFPFAWTHAQLKHPDVDCDFKRDGKTESYTLNLRFTKPIKLRAEIPARFQHAKVTVNGATHEAKISSDSAVPKLEFECSAANAFTITIAWAGEPVSPKTPEEPTRRMVLAQKHVKIDWKQPLPQEFHVETVDLTSFFNDSVTQIFKNEYRSPRSPFCSLAIPKQGIGAWAGFVNATAEIDDSGLRAFAKSNNGRFLMPNGVAFATPAEGKNIIFTSQWDNYPREVTVPLSGQASQLLLLMAGSTNWMQSHIDNGEVIATYMDGTTSRLALYNPTTWWPIEQDYFIDDYQFRYFGSFPPRVDLKTGKVRFLDRAAFKGQGREVGGGAATVLTLSLDPNKELRSLTIRALSNEVVIGLMSATLVR